MAKRTVDRLVFWRLDALWLLGDLEEILEEDLDLPASDRSWLKDAIEAHALAHGSTMVTVAHVHSALAEGFGPEGPTPTQARAARAALLRALG